MVQVNGITLGDVLNGYANGRFLMGEEGTGLMYWEGAETRGVIPLDGRFHVPHGLKRELRKRTFEVRVDTAFREVMESCAVRPREGDGSGVWITPEIIEVFGRLHELGFAHSVEAYDREGRLAGGLYGVHLGRAFFGESMFHRQSNASKVALVGLVNLLRDREVELLDCQWLGDHLRQYGAYEVGKVEYGNMLEKALEGVEGLVVGAEAKKAYRGWCVLMEEQ